MLGKGARFGSGEGVWEELHVEIWGACWKDLHVGRWRWRGCWKELHVGSWRWRGCWKELLVKKRGEVLERAACSEMEMERVLKRAAHWEVEMVL